MSWSFVMRLVAERGVFAPLRMSMMATLWMRVPGWAGSWWTEWRLGGQFVGASSLMAVQGEDSSTMVLPLAQALAAR